MTYPYDISVIIVNYNVRHFVVECLESFRRSQLGQLRVQVFVVDNASIDGSVEVIADQYPEVELIANKHNVGFSKANNQAIRLANGKYILLLNPDTVLEEDTLAICHQYMEEHSSVGALGVKMIDGAGIFLPESKRALPSPWNSLTKLLGLSSVFPKSSVFNGYALGHLSADERHQIEVLCGAFMFMPSHVLDEVGLLDERFFMYGEDIDLSYRIVKAGYEVHYIPDTTIIHYKGESTKKGSLNYVKTFYNAMGLYVDKHYTGGGAAVFGQLLKLGIWARASISAGRRLVSRLLPKLADIALVYGGLYTFAILWATYYFGDKGYYEGSPLSWNIGLYSMLWVFAAWLVGFYKNSKSNKRLQATLLGTVTILGMYALLPDSYRTSRILILAGTIVTWLVLTITASIRSRKGGSTKSKNVLIVAEQKQAKAIQEHLQNSKTPIEVAGLVYPKGTAFDSNIYVNNLDHLQELSKVLKVEEVIFSTEDMTTKEIMKTMMQLDSKLSFKIAGDESLTILGSKSKNTSGEIYDVDLQYNLNTEYHRHTKRVFDVLVALLYLLGFPITLLLNRLRVRTWASTIISTLTGRKSWVGYADADHRGLPLLKEGIFMTNLADRDYARNYSIWLDLDVMLRHYIILPSTPL